MPNKIDSNLTGLSFALETVGTIGELPGTPDWLILEPNAYSQFGSMQKLTTRDPIKSSRMTSKGLITDRDTSADFQIDVTSNALNDLMPVFVSSPWDERPNQEPTAVSVTGTDHYVVSSSTNFIAGHLIFASGFSTAANNGLKRVTAVAAGEITCASQGLVAEASPPAGAKVEVVGFQFATGDLTASLSSSIPTLACTTADFEDSLFGLGAGDWVFIGGDTAGTQFTGTPAINGWARIASIAATSITMDKVSGTWATDSGSGKTLRIFFGHFVNNQAAPADQVMYSIQLERSLSTGGFEYVVGAVANEMTINLQPSTKVTADLKFIGLDSETRTTVEGAKSGNRPALVVGYPLNTSSDFSRLTVLDETGAPIPGSSLTTYIMDGSITIANNASPTKALTVIGAFDITLGNINVTGKLTAFFTDPDQMLAISENRDVSIDLALIRNQVGYLVDIPRVSLSDGRLNVVKDKPIEIPYTFDASEHEELGYIIKVTRFPYLPLAAE